jgi:hypothetical protein
MPVVRISRGSFKLDDYSTIAKLLDESQRTLVPDIRQLGGCLHYWAAIDQRSNTMVNVSVWGSLIEAKQMETFAPMAKLAEEFIKLGVVFERPIVNYEILWEI